jgi:hypothetical protein
MILLRCPMLVANRCIGTKTHKEGSGSVKGTGAVERAAHWSTKGAGSARSALVMVTS